MVKEIILLCNLIYLLNSCIVFKKTEKESCLNAKDYLELLVNVNKDSVVLDKDYIEIEFILYNNTDTSVFICPKCFVSLERVTIITAFDQDYIKVLESRCMNKDKNLGFYNANLFSSLKEIPPHSKYIEKYLVKIEPPLFIKGKNNILLTFVDNYKIEYNTIKKVCGKFEKMFTLIVYE